MSPNDVATAFAYALARPVRVDIVPREQWEHLFRAQGMNNPMPRIRMIDGFNEGWIDFHSGQVVRSTTTLQQVVSALVEAENDQHAA